jgi:hypothetical protein
MTTTQTGDVRLDAAHGAAARATEAQEIPTATEERERFLPLTRHALMDRLTRPTAWTDGNAAQARRFFRYLDHWRQQTYVARLMEMEQTYEAFSPDSDLLVTRTFSANEKADMRKRLVAQVARLMSGANYHRVDPAQVEIIMTKESHYGLDFQIDLDAFDELLIFYRGKTTKTEERRTRKSLYLKKEEFELPIYQRLFILFKLKPVEQRIREIMAKKGCERRQAEKIVTKLRSMLPQQVQSDYVYLKLFKNIPQADLEMIFPNTRIKFRVFDKVKLGATSGAGLGAGVFGAAGKLALLTTNPIAAAGAAVGLGGVAFRQAMKFVNQKNTYMLNMAQNLYFHAMADNRGVMTLMADRAAEEDIKEEMLLYSVLAKERVKVGDIGEVDAAIEQYLLNTYGISVDFDVRDALQRLVADGIVAQAADGTLVTLPPKDAAARIDVLWDTFLDGLPDIAPNEGREFDTEEEARA